MSYPFTLLCCLLFLTGARPASQTATPADAARSIVDAAVATLGGMAQLQATDGWYLEGRGRENLSAEMQGVAPDRPTWRPHQEKVAVNRAGGAVAWERRTPRNDQSLRWRRFIYTPAGSGVLDWTVGRYSASPNVQPAAVRESLMRRVPHLLVLDAATRASQLVHAGERRIGRSRHDAIDATLADGSRLTLIFSRNPVLLAGVEYPLQLPGRGDVVVRWSWDGWMKVTGAERSHVWRPARHAIDISGTPFQQVEYTRYESLAADASALIAAADRPNAPPPAPAAPPSAAPATGEVAPGVHVTVIQGFTVMFVEFRDFVVALDAPESHPGLEAIPPSVASPPGTLTRDYLAAIARTSGGKPVRYVVVSHHHSDHMGGVPGFAAAGATILAAPSHAAAVRRLTAGSHARVETVRDRRTITDGERTLEIINVGPNPHTTENLFAWLPRERLVFQADLFYYSEGAPFPPSGRATMNRFFATWLQRHQIEPRAIYGVHSRGGIPNPLSLIPNH